MNATDRPTGTIHDRLAWIMEHVPVIAKAQMERYTAFAIDDVYTNLRGLFGKAGVYLMPRLATIDYVDGSQEKTRNNKAGFDETYVQTFTDVRLVMEYQFWAADGTTVSMIVPGESRDYGDKGTFQATQQAIKYGFVQAFMVATGEPDADDGPRTRPVDHVWAILAGLEPVDTKTVFDRLWAGISDGDPADMDAGQAALLLVNYWRGTADE